MKFEKAKNIVILGEFENIHGEKFVIFFCTKPGFGKDYPVLYITGDEFDWELVELYFLGAREFVRVIATIKGFTGKFLFSIEEQKEIIEIVKDFNPDIIDWLMNPIGK